MQYNANQNSNNVYTQIASTTLFYTTNHHWIPVIVGFITVLHYYCVSHF